MNFVSLIVHLKMPLLKHLQNLVTPYYAASWKEIGLQFGIAQGILQTIETYFQGDVETCCTEMLKEWLETDVTASWGKLIQVIYSPAATEMINTFNKSLYIRKGPIESAAVEELENKLKVQHIITRYKSSQDDWFSMPEHFTSNLLQDGTIDLSEQTLSAVNMYTLSSFLARCVQRHWSLLDLSNCYLDDENFQRFYKSYANLSKSTVYINTVNLSSNVFTQASASKIGRLILDFNVKKLILAANEIKDIGIDQSIFVALLEYPNLVKSKIIAIQDESQVVLVLYKKGLNNSIVSELFIMYYCSIETYKDVCLYIENNSSFFEKFISTNSALILNTILHRLINKMTFFSTNFKLYVNSTNVEINSVISSLASDVPLAVCIGESFLPLHLCNIDDKITGENEIFNNLGTIFFCGKFSIRTMHSLFCLFLAKPKFI